MRTRIHVAYEGTNYHGWQIQPDCPTIEGALTKAAATILDRPPETIKIQGASRTDAGVHAVGQVAHIDHDGERSNWEFVRGLNGLTDDAICVTRAEGVDDAFNARFSSRGKIYRYDIWNHRFQHPLQARQTWQYRHALDADRMARGAEAMVGTYDFEAFRASDCSAETTVRTMTRVEVVRDGPLIRVIVEGDAFLKYMVRVMVGTLVDVGRGFVEAEAVSEIIASGERGRAGRTAPPDGLTLMEVFYPDFPWDGDEPEIGGACLPGGRMLPEDIDPG